MTAVVASKSWRFPFVLHQQKNSRHTKPPQTHISFIVPRPKGIGSRHKIKTGNNQVRKQITPHDNLCYNRKESHSNINELSSTLISVSTPLNNLVINPPQLSSVGQQSSRSSHNTPCDNLCFNSKYSNSNINELSSMVIPVRNPLNDSVINPPHMSSIGQKYSISSHNTTHELQASSKTSWNSPDTSNTMPLPSNNNGSRNTYVCMVDVSKLSLSQLQKHAVMLLHRYQELCNTNHLS